MEEKGIKEMLEVMEFMKVLGVKLGVAFKDGLQPQDALVALDPQVWAAAQVAFEGIKEIPAEAKNLSIAEGGQLALKGFEIAEAIVKAVK